MFHHVQIFADVLKPMHEYKALEAHLNELANKGHFDPFSGGMRFLEENAHQTRVREGNKCWESICGQPIPQFVPSGQDVVEQLIVGLGWRVTAEVRGTILAALLYRIFRIPTLASVAPFSPSLFACALASGKVRHGHQILVDVYALKVTFSPINCSIRGRARAPCS